MIRFLAAALAAGLAAHAVAQDPEGRAPFITTPSEVVERMLRFAGTGPSDLVVDLGSGDGRIVMDAARKFGARGLGIELDPALVRKSRDLVREANLADRVSIVQGDVLHADISQATVVTVYLLPFLIGKLQPRFVDELKPGTRIVSHAFYMPSWKADRSETMRISGRHDGQGDQSTLYLWVVPAKARGTWEGSGWSLRIHQNFQEIEVEARHQGKHEATTRAKLSGAEISWESPGGRFRGRVEGDVISGDFDRAGAATPVSFRRR